MLLNIDILDKALIISSYDGATLVEQKVLNISQIVSIETIFAYNKNNMSGMREKNVIVVITFSNGLKEQLFLGKIANQPSYTNDMTGAINFITNIYSNF